MKETAEVQIRVYPKDNKRLKRLLKTKKAEQPQACIADVIRDLLGPEPVEAQE